MQLRLIEEPEAPPLPPLLTIAQVAEACQVSTRTVQRAISDGRLNAFRLARRGTWRLRPEDVDEWLAVCAYRPSPSPPSPPITSPPAPSSRPRVGRPTGHLSVPDARGPR